VLPRADGAGAQLRPAFSSRYERQSFGGAHLHGKPIGESIAPANSGFLRVKLIPKWAMDLRTGHKKREALTHNSGYTGCGKTLMRSKKRQGTTSVVL
jgi:hypothetical protein